MKMRRTVLAIATLVSLAAGLTVPATPAMSAGPTPASVVPPAYPLAPGETEVSILAKAERSLHSSGRVGSSQWVGLAYPKGSVVSRLYYSFDLSGLPADSITSVMLYNSQVFSPNRTCYLDSYGPAVAVTTTTKWPAKLTWPGPKPNSAKVTSGYAQGSRTACFPVQDQEWDVTDIVRAAAAKSSTVYLRLASTNEKDRRGYRRYNTEISGTPKLGVLLIPHPNQPTDVAVSPVVPNHPRSALSTKLPMPLITYATNATLTAQLTTPGGCAGTTALFTCLGARYEVADGDGTVIRSGTATHLWESDGVATLSQSIGPLQEGEVYTARVWGVNTQSGLESSPGSVQFRYDAPPVAPTVVQPDQWTLNQPIEVSLTANDDDAIQACWEVLDRDTWLVDCAPVTPHEETTLTLSDSGVLGTVTGNIWVVDTYGTPGLRATIQGSVSW